MITKHVKMLHVKLHMQIMPHKIQNLIQKQMKNIRRNRKHISRRISLNILHNKKYLRKLLKRMVMFGLIFSICMKVQGHMFQVLMVTGLLMVHMVVLVYMVEITKKLKCITLVNLNIVILISQHLIPVNHQFMTSSEKWLVKRFGHLMDGRTGIREDKAHLMKVKVNLEMDMMVSICKLMVVMQVIHYMQSLMVS